VLLVLLWWIAMKLALHPSRIVSQMRHVLRWNRICPHLLLLLLLLLLLEVSLLLLLVGEVAVTARAKRACACARASGR